jgi:beta-lactamase class A
VGFLFDVMITRSDNTATNTLIERVGRANVTSFMASIGLRRAAFTELRPSVGRPRLQELGRRITNIMHERL